MKKHVLFIGIDISKKWIDVAAGSDGQKKNMRHRQFPNDLKGFKKMVHWLAQSHTTGTKAGYLFCMEHTGVYTVPLCAFLQEQGFSYVLDSALRIKRSLGIKRGKDDKADSMDIARYVYLNHKDLKTSSLPAQVLVDLKNLLAYRNRLLKKLHGIKVGAKETKAFSADSPAMDWIMDDSEDLVRVLKGKVKKVEALIKKHVEKDREVKKVFDLATSVKGIGLVTALQIIVHTNCFKAFETSRQFACYIGIAPFHRKSGTSLDVKAKVSPLGHKKTKSIAQQLCHDSCPERQGAKGLL